MRNLVDFGYHNLVKEPYPSSLLGSWDIIFCRNVTIYFRPSSTKRVVKNFFKSLVFDGYLFVGHAETLYQISSDFVPVRFGDVFVYKKTHDRPKEKTIREDKERQEVLKVCEQKADTPRDAVSAPSAGSPDESTESMPAERLCEQVHRYLDQGENGMAEQLLEEHMARTDCPDVECEVLFARVLAEKGQNERAMKHCATVLGRDPLNVAARYLRGLILKEQNMTEEALKELKRVVYTDRDFAPAYIQIANIYLTMEQKDNAARALTNSIEAMKRQPNGDWLEFSGGYVCELLVETCQSMLANIDITNGERGGRNGR